MEVGELLLPASDGEIGFCRDGEPPLGHSTPGVVDVNVIIPPIIGDAHAPSQSPSQSHHKVQSPDYEQLLRHADKEIGSARSWRQDMSQDMTSTVSDNSASFESNVDSGLPTPPPPESADEPTITDIDESDESDDVLPAAVVVGLRTAAVIGALLVPIVLVIVLILGVKWRQRRRRLRGPPAERIRGAWSVAIGW